MKNKAYIIICLAISYSIWIASSEYGDELTRYSHVHGNVRYTICLNAGAQQPSEKIPDILPACAKTPSQKTAQAGDAYDNSGSESDDCDCPVEDGHKTLHYRTMNVSNGSCWDSCLYFVRSCFCKSKKS